MVGTVSRRPAVNYGPPRKSFCVILYSSLFTRDEDFAQAFLDTFLKCRALAKCVSEQTLCFPGLTIAGEKCACLNAGHCAFKEQHVRNECSHTESLYRQNRRAVSGRCCALGGRAAAFFASAHFMAVTF